MSLLCSATLHDICIRLALLWLAENRYDVFKLHVGSKYYIRTLYDTGTYYSTIQYRTNCLLVSTCSFYLVHKYSISEYFTVKYM